MPDYDEYGIAYKERGALNPHKIQAIGRNGNIIFNRLIVMDGIVIGGWKTAQTKNGIEVQTFPKVKLDKTKLQALQKAVKRYKDFIIIVI